MKRVRLDNSDMVFGRDYSEQYEAPIRRGDEKNIAITLLGGR